MAQIPPDEALVDREAVGEQSATTLPTPPGGDQQERRHSATAACVGAAFRRGTPAPRIR
jgi:hypothetical protein